MKTIIRSISNMRDLGKSKYEESKLKTGSIYRAAYLHELQNKDLKKYNDLKIDKIIDLRFNNEVKDKPDKLTKSIYIHIPFMNDTNGITEKDIKESLKHADINSYNEVYKTFEDIYSHLYNNEALREVFKTLSNHESFLFHCSGGKDRTGVTAFILMKLFGYSDETCKKEYMDTKKYRLKYEFRLNIFRLFNPMPKYAFKILKLCYSRPQESLFNLMYKTLYDKYNSVEEFIINEYNYSINDINDWKKYYMK